jgi:hypothetical protein
MPASSLSRYSVSTAQHMGPTGWISNTCGQVETRAIERHGDQRVWTLRVGICNRRADLGKTFCFRRSTVAFRVDSHTPTSDAPSRLPEGLRATCRGTQIPDADECGKYSRTEEEDSTSLIVPTSANHAPESTKGARNRQALHVLSISVSASCSDMQDVR